MKHTVQIINNSLASISNSIRKHRIMLSVALIGVVACVPILGLPSYILRIGVMIMIYAILALGLNIPTGYTGQVSIGHAGFFSIGAYTSAILVTQAGWSMLPAMAAAAVIAGIFGFLLGLPTLRVSGTYLSICTLGFAEIVRMAVLNWDALTNGPMGIKNIPYPTVFGVEMTLRNYGSYYMILVMLVMTSVFVHLIINSKIGRAFRSIKEDELASMMMGVFTMKYKILSFVLSAIISGMVGAFYAHFMRYIDPNSFTFDTSILILSIVILGGMGTMRGMFLGAIILVSFPEALRFLEQYRFVFYGLVLVIMMRYRPQGLLGWRSKSPYEFPKGVDPDKIARGFNNSSS
jgi:branched-chain amino acid transport system permease protein